MKTIECSQHSEGDVALREACLDSLTTFAEAFGSNYRAAVVHRHLACKLQDCARRKIRRIVISCPPRTGKSLLTSIMFPAWSLTKAPALKIIQASYSSELSELFSRATKAVLTSEPYRAFFPPILDPAAQRLKSWQTLAGGSYYATGVGGGATGRGADIFICDDLIKNRDEASSVTHRDKVWDWFMSTAMTRLSPNGVMIVIATRWHEDDLIGRLTSTERLRQFREHGLTDELFDVINLEALCESPESDPFGREFGEALWPEQWPVERLAATKLQIGPQEFAAQYQGRPSPKGGNLVDCRKIKIIERDELPLELRTGRGWDLASSTKTQGDYSVGAQGGMDPNGNFYLTNINRGKRAWPEQKRAIVQCAEMDGASCQVGIETVAAWTVALEEIELAIAGRFVVRGFTPNKDKIGRANPWLAKIDGGAFFMTRAPWNQDFLHELEQFPNGGHDDQIDAVSVLWDMVRKRDSLVWA